MTHRVNDVKQQTDQPLDPAPNPAEQLTNLKLRRKILLRELIETDREIRALNCDFPPMRHWPVNTYQCHCGQGEFLDYLEFILHIMEMDLPHLHYDPLNPPRKVQCPHCFATFIHRIPTNHDENCKIKVTIRSGNSSFNLSDLE